MKKILSALIVLILLSACGSPASTSPTADLPELVPPSPAPVDAADASQPTLAVVATEEVIEAATPVCIASEPAQEDIDRALSFTGMMFGTNEWERSYTVTDDSVAVTWYSELLYSVVFLEALIFPCSYEEPDLDAFFSAENWQIVFGNYQSYSPVGECRNDSGLRLYKFTAVDQGIDYDIRYWTVNDTDTRVLTFMIVLPTVSEALMDDYAYKLFPQFSDCP
ncbi:MAG: hypothetical protein JNK32_10900 [Anaerolineales bacterium]|nr:hypothetical protein [Anaerolineales bacterium]